MSAQLLYKPLQVFFCSDEVWSIKKSGVILAGVVIPQFSSFHVSQNKTKRQVDLKGCGLLSKDPAYHLWKGGRCHIMQGKIIPVLDTIAGHLLCTDGIPVS
jgi:hypothetical protein